MTFDEQEDPRYLNEQILTYLGNKRTLLDGVGQAVRKIRTKCGGRKLTCFDVFSGTGIVSRYLKKDASHIYANDLEAYSRVVNECYLSNWDEVEWLLLKMHLADLREKLKDENLRSGFIRELYAPQDEKNIQRGERVFYTIRNAKYLDTARQEIAMLPLAVQKYFLGSLLYGASVCNNTGGVFKGFYKNKEGIGQYGGTAQNCLTRICHPIELELPVLSRFACTSTVLQKDARVAAKEVPEVDLAYLDPPYNQHPFGSNYFMLNLLVEYQRPAEISAVSGIPNNWNRSLYNVRAQAKEELFALISELKTKNILISYNSEGFVPYEDFVEFLSSLGSLSSYVTEYNTYRACRNLRQRELHVKEYLFLLER